MRRVRIICPECEGQAVYYGMGESKGVAVPCINCGAKGWVPAKDTFKKIELRNDIRTVRVGGIEIPYLQFIAARDAENNETD